MGKEIVFIDVVTLTEEELADLGKEEPEDNEQTAE